MRLQQAAAKALHASVPIPEDGRWSRQDLCKVDLGLRRTAVRAAAMALVDHADQLSSNAIQAVADAVGDNKNHLRRFELGSHVLVSVHAHDVLIGQEPT